MKGGRTMLFFIAGVLTGGTLAIIFLLIASTWSDDE